MYHLLKHKKGQSTVEYIVIVTVIALVVVTFGPILARRYQDSSDTASQAMPTVAGQINTALSN